MGHFRNSAESVLSSKKLLVQRWFFMRVLLALLVIESEKLIFMMKNGLL